MTKPDTTQRAYFPIQSSSVTFKVMIIVLKFVYLSTHTLKANSSENLG